ncbi:hypothetical protein PEP31012_03570 [Pandoraea eparura]|uniref:Uncharacterized protein n=1 Tax=Pandoraea eparura TaxID=2508291 RepID=A0A5E4WYH6_9BURK|nr:hypothetical protein [Pandoraea eparura]VVE29040.1 hypothetical protein PEP31012_03570 [Pandoraea eparura]
MTAPNRRSVVHGHQIAVTLVTGKPEASIAIQPPPSMAGGLHPPKHVSIEALLKGGMSEEEALDYVLNIASAGVQGHSPA